MEKYYRYRLVVVRLQRESYVASDIR